MPAPAAWPRRLFPISHPNSADSTANTLAQNSQSCSRCTRSRCLGLCARVARGNRHPDNCPRTLSSCSSAHKYGDRRIAIFPSTAAAPPAPEHSPENPSAIPPLHPDSQKQNFPRYLPLPEPAHFSRGRNRTPLRIPPSPSTRHRFHTSIRDRGSEIVSRNLAIPSPPPRRDAGRRCKTRATHHLLRALQRLARRQVAP